MRKLLALVAVAVLVGVATMLWWRLDHGEYAASMGAHPNPFPDGNKRRASAEGTPGDIMPPPNALLSGVYQQLRASAERGSAVAACRIAQEISRCANEMDSLEVADILSRVPKLPGEKQSLSEAVLNSTSDSENRCEGAAGLMEEGYRYQRLAALHGGRAYQRWLVLRPLLDQQNFLADIDGWKDYEARAKGYVRDALKSRSGDDLALLVNVYAPPGLPILRPPYQVEDRITFIALSRVAKGSGVSLSIPVKNAADEIEVALTPEQQDAVHRRILELGTRWVVSDRSQFPQDAYKEAAGESFCK